MDVNVRTQGRYSSWRCELIVDGRTVVDDVDLGGHAFVYCSPTYIQSMDGSVSYWQQQVVSSGHVVEQQPWT